MSVEEYLDRHGVTAYVKDVVTLLVENRPAQPLHFMAEYFHNVVTGSSTIVRACRYIRLARHDQPAFMDNLVAAYVCVDEAADGGGFRGAELGKLVRRLTSGLPSAVATVVERASARRAADAVGFSDFAAAVRLCLLVEDLVAVAADVALETGGGGPLFDGLLAAVAEQADAVRSVDAVPTPAALEETLGAAALDDASSSNGRMMLEDFQLRLVEAALRDAS